MRGCASAADAGRAGVAGAAFGAGRAEGAAKPEATPRCGVAGVGAVALDAACAEGAAKAEETPRGDAVVVRGATARGIAGSTVPKVVERVRTAFSEFARVAGMANAEFAVVPAASVVERDIRAAFGWVGVPKNFACPFALPCHTA